MPCIFCSHNVPTYHDCSCFRATKFKNSTEGGRVLFAEKLTARCRECKLHLTPQDVTGIARINGKLADQYKCPHCGHEQKEHRVPREERYK